jgi:hypothetical protein
LADFPPTQTTTRRSPKAQRRIMKAPSRFIHPGIDVKAMPLKEKVQKLRGFQATTTHFEKSFEASNHTLFQVGTSKV